VVSGQLLVVSFEFKVSSLGMADFGGVLFFFECFFVPILGIKTSLRQAGF